MEHIEAKVTEPKGKRATKAREVWQIWEADEDGLWWQTLTRFNEEDAVEYCDDCLGHARMVHFPFPAID